MLNLLLLYKVANTKNAYEGSIVYRRNLKYVVLERYFFSLKNISNFVCLLEFPIDGFLYFIEFLINLFPV